MKKISKLEHTVAKTKVFYDELIKDRFLVGTVKLLLYVD